jgi:hypothetical protein
MSAQSSQVHRVDQEIPQEISRVVRVSSPFEELTPSQGARTLRRLDLSSAFAVVVLASAGVLCAAVWMLEHWQLR